MACLAWLKRFALFRLMFKSLLCISFDIVVELFLVKTPFVEFRLSAGPLSVFCVTMCAFGNMTRGLGSYW